MHSCIATFNCLLCACAKLYMFCLVDQTRHDALISCSSNAVLCSALSRSQSASAYARGTRNRYNLKLPDMDKDEAPVIPTQGLLTFRFASKRRVSFHETSYTCVCIQDMHIHVHAYICVCVLHVCMLISVCCKCVCVSVCVCLCLCVRAHVRANNMDACSCTYAA